MVKTLPSRASLLQWFVVILLCCPKATIAGLCPEQESVDITNGTKDEAGRVEYGGVLYSSSQYFQDGSVRRGCVCLVRQCIYVCEAEEWESTESKQVYANVSDADGKNYRRVDLAADHRFYLILGKRNCSEDWTPIEHNELNITSKGELKVNAHFGEVINNYENFCLIPNDVTGEFDACYFLPEPSDLQHTVYAFGFLVSLPFLVATFLVYAILPELHNLPGMSLMCYVTSLAVSYLLLALARMDVYEHRSVICHVTGYTVYFTLMASFFWLNIMSFDIYWTFAGSRGLMTERQKFSFYCLYAWGTPVLFVSLIFLFDHTTLISDKSLRPNVGEERCFLSEENLTQFLYVYLPLLLLISANIFFFVSTALRIYQTEQANVDMMRGNSRRHTTAQHDRHRFGLYLRLFTIMGITWSLEIISWLVNDSTAHSPSWIIYVLDIWNCLVGIIIFFMFVWKQRVKKLLLHRFTKSKSTMETSFNTNTTRNTKPTIEIASC
ncbi:G-protein coupled receptor Mth2-like [Anopheles albimanus]|uniref:G-protein coupled receptors family 2 profile 2 domain-containing protein n=1 Tax=Anopheles albimanus TaxID=7167 RepID=A0A182FE97_ANOAL|nr:G-protein coupled receptor Mth2-like [Anopheles albimanus]